MAKAKTAIKMISTEGTGTFYVTKKNPKNNTKKLEFAPATSADELTLYFTRLDMKALFKGKPGAFAIMVATRANRTSPWGVPRAITAITGHAEAPSVTPDGCAIYFHRKDGGIFRLYLTRRIGCTGR